MFEVRQGYKSKDSKRQNADLANAAFAYTQGYLPVVVLFSQQIDNDVVGRYEQEKWLVLRGSSVGTPIQSTYTFVRDVIGYDLEGFFNRYANQLQSAINEVLDTLLSRDG